MKRLFITIGLIAIISLVSKSQPISNDTVVCIIDTTQCYVRYKENPFAPKNKKFHWQVSIQGHYYDIERPLDKDFACIVFSTDDLSSFYPENKGSWQIKIQKGKIKERFFVETDEWINKQTDLGTLARRIGSMPRDKCNFIVFKQDFDNAKSDSVTMQRVTVGYCEIVN
jgi:hypothetical protein